MAGGNPTLYGYVCDTNIELDLLGLFKVWRNLRPDEVVSDGLSAKLPGRNMSIIMKSIQAARPIIPVYWPDSSKPTNAAYDALWANPLMISERDYSGYSDEDFSSVRGTFSVNLNFNKWIKGLSADGKFDYRLNNKFVKTFNTCKSRKSWPAVN